MGSAKDWFDKKEDCRHIAEEICVRAKVLARCEFCNDIYDNLAGDWTPAFKLGNYLITHKDPLVKDLDGDRQLLSEMINELKDTPLLCECKRRMQDDD